MNNINYHAKSTYIVQASTLTQNVTGPIRPVTPSIYWSCKIFTDPTHFSLTFQQKTLHKIHRLLFSLVLSSFISKTFGDILEGKLELTWQEQFGYFVLLRL